MSPLKRLRLWLPLINIVVASALLFLGYAQNRSHQGILRAGNVMFEFDYLPSAFAWLAAVYAPCGLLTFPVAAIPGVPRSVVIVWFLLCVSGLSYWIGLQIEASRKGLPMASGRRSDVIIDLFGISFGLVLCFLSAFAALRGAWPLIADASGFVWGMVLSTLFLKNIRRGRRSTVLSNRALS